MWKRRSDAGKKGSVICEIIHCHTELNVIVAKVNRPVATHQPEACIYYIAEPLRLSAPALTLPDQRIPHLPVSNPAQP